MYVINEEGGGRTIKQIGCRKERVYKVNGKTYLKSAREAHPIVKVAIDRKYRKLLLQSSLEDSSITETPQVIEDKTAAGLP